jgi:uncharacterized protein YqeY
MYGTAHRMTIQERIQKELKEAMKQKDALRLSVLRMLSSAFQSRQIEKRAKTGNQSAALSDEEIYAVLRHEAKKCTDSEAQFAAAGRSELAKKEKKEAGIIREYIPQEMDDAALEAIARETITSMGHVTEKDFGKVMGAIMKHTNGRASGDRVSTIIKAYLSRAQ